MQQVKEMGRVLSANAYYQRRIKTSKETVIVKHSGMNCLTLDVSLRMGK